MNDSSGKRLLPVKRRPARLGVMACRYGNKTRFVGFRFAHLVCRFCSSCPEIVSGIALEGSDLPVEDDVLANTVSIRVRIHVAGHVLVMWKIRHLVAEGKV